MSAQIPETMLLSDLLKATGYDCPEELVGKTFTEATSGGEGPTLVDLTATENKVYTPDEGKAYGKVTVNVPSDAKTEVTLTATENKTYTPVAGSVFSEVTVAVPAPTVKLYAWKNDTAIVYTKTNEPTTSDTALVPASTGLSDAVIAVVAEEFASITIGETVYEAYTTGDITVSS